MAAMDSPLRSMDFLEDMPYPQEPMDLEEEQNLNDFVRDLMPAGLENEVPETSLLYDQNRIENIQDFCSGAEFDFSLPVSGDGSFSPQTITTADVPGWVDRYPDRVGENMNLFDCMDEDLKGDFWFDKNFIDQNEKFCSDEIFAIEDDFELRRDLTPPLSPLPFVEEKYSVNSAEDNCADLQALQPLLNTEKSVAYESPASDSRFISEPYSLTCLPELTHSESFSSTCVEECSVTNVEAQAPVAYEDGAQLEINTGEPPVIVLDDEPIVEKSHTVTKCSPKIIRIPISAVFKKPKVQSRKTRVPEPIIETPKLSFHEPQLPKNNSRIVYLKKVSVPVKSEVKPEPVHSKVKPEPVHSKVKPELVLKDVISGDGDELLKELLTTCKSENSRSQASLTDCYSSTSRPRTPVYWDDDEDYQPCYQPGRKRAAYTKEEKKLRKKEQNKRAAMRYREKKKDEFHSLTAEIRELTEATAREEEKLHKTETEKDLLRGLVKDIIKRRLLEME